MKKLLLIILLAVLGFVACKKNEDVPNYPRALPVVPWGQYRLDKMEFRNSNHQLIEIITQSNDSTQYFYYKEAGQFKKVIRVQPHECIENWSDFMNTFVGSITYDSTQFIPSVNGVILHFYLGWQGIDDREYLFYYLSKTDYIPADTVSCN